MFQACGFHGYFLSVVGGVMTMSALLIMTDWQAIGHDPCLEKSIFHNHDLVEEYRMHLNESVRIESYDECSEYLVPGSSDIFLNSLSVYFSIEFSYKIDSNVDCVLVPECPFCDNTSQGCREVLRTFHCLPADENVKVLCKMDHSISTCLSVRGNSFQVTNVSHLEEVHLQSLVVVRDSVYEFAVQKCESTDHCHWIPNSHITHEHCHDCQPICRNIDRTLNFVQFSVGLILLMCTMEVMYIGMFLLLSDSVSKNYQVRQPHWSCSFSFKISFQGICAGSMVAAIGTARSTAPLWCKMFTNDILLV